MAVESRCRVLKYSSVTDQLCVKECVENPRQHIPKCPARHYTKLCWPVYNIQYVLYLHCSCMSVWEVMTTPDTPTLLKGPIILELARWQQMQLVMATRFTLHNAHTQWQHSLTITCLTCYYFFYRKSSFSFREGALKRGQGVEERQEKMNREWKRVGHIELEIEKKDQQKYIYLRFHQWHVKLAASKFCNNLSIVFT